MSALELLDTAPEHEFDVIVGLARSILHCDIALVSLVDANRQWFKARCGLDVSETPREQSFCSHAIEIDRPLVVPDATLDPRFQDSPLVVGAPFIRFYAGVPIRAKTSFGSSDSVAIGTLCVIDPSPRQLDAHGLSILRDLALMVEALIDARMANIHIHRLAAERQTHIHQLHREQMQFKQAERMAGIGSWRLDLGDLRTTWSQQVFAIHEMPVGEAPHHEETLAFYPPHARAIMTAAIARAIEVGEAFDIEVDFVTAKGHPRRVRSIAEIERIDGKAVALLGVFQDVTARHDLEQTLRKVANTDDLTQLPNRARLNEFLDDAIANAVANRTGLAVLLIDIDGFKMVNDQCGHLAGDELLRIVSTRLRAAYLSRCFPARLGGDEFVLVVTEPEDLAELENLTRRLLGELRHLVGFAGGAVPVSGTIGVCRLDDKIRVRRELLHRADIALYAAKNQRRGCAKLCGQDALIEPLTSNHRNAPTRAGVTDAATLAARIAAGA